MGYCAFLYDSDLFVKCSSQLLKGDECTVVIQSLLFNAGLQIQNFSGLETINYIKENIKENSEIEFWHVWLGNDTTEAVVKKEMSLKDLKPENLEEILYADVCREPIYDYCLVIKA